MLILVCVVRRVVCACVFLFLPQSDFFAACIELAPPPTAELKAAGKKMAKGGAGKLSSKKGGARGVGGTAAENASAAIGERRIGDKVQHEDFAGENGRKGRWRSCLAESGKVGFGCCPLVCFRVCVRKRRRGDIRRDRGCTLWHVFLCR